MIVRLTDTQARACLDALDGPAGDALGDLALMSNMTKTRADYDMPYIAWCAVFKQVFERTYVTRELRDQRRSVTAAMSKAIRAMAASMNAWERLPALRNQVQLHWQPGPVVPVWAMPFGYAWASANTARPWITDWAPFPIEGVQPMLLKPEHFTQDNVPYTRWSPVERVPANDDWVPGDDAIEASFKDLAASFLIPVGVQAP